MSLHKRSFSNAAVWGLAGVLTLATSACFVFDDGPAEVTRDFWNAAQEGNGEMVDALSIGHSDRFDLDSGEEIESISIGDADIDGDEAEVLTVIEASDGDADLEIEFKTALVKRDGDWYVEIDETTGRLVGAMVAEIGSQFGEAFSEDFGEAMSEMADGLAEGLNEVSDALREAADDLREQAEDRERERRRNR